MKIQIVAAIISLMATAFTPVPHAEDYVLINGKILNGVDDQILENKVVYISGRKISNGQIALKRIPFGVED